MAINVSKLDKSDYAENRWWL